MEPGDEVLDSGLYLCARIAGLDKHDGVAFLCERNMYIIDNFGINAEGELEELGAPDEPRKFTVSSCYPSDCCRRYTYRARS